MHIQVHAYLEGRERREDLPKEDADGAERQPPELALLEQLVHVHGEELGGPARIERVAHRLRVALALAEGELQRVESELQLSVLENQSLYSELSRVYQRAAEEAGAGAQEVAGAGAQEVVTDQVADAVKEEVKQELKQEERAE